MTCVVGLLDDEIVLRGGNLSRPTVLSKLIVVDGKRFVRLARNSKTIREFLCPGGKGVAWAAARSVFEDIAALRLQFVQNFLRGEPASRQEVTQEIDQVEQLGLDAADSGTNQPLGLVPNRRRKAARVIMKQMPSYFEARLPRAGHPDWCSNLLVKTGNTAASIEASGRNLQTLLEIVAAKGLRQAEDGDERAPKKVSSRSPRGEVGAREYWIASKQRWVKVAYAQEAQGRKRKRTLVRRASGDASSHSAVLPIDEGLSQHTKDTGDAQLFS